MARRTKTPTRYAKHVCSVCHGLLGPVPEDRIHHVLCDWATPADWKALEPWFGDLARVLRDERMSGTG